MHLLIFGAPGVGKGTQAKILSQRWGLPHVSTGDMFREAIRSQSELGKKVEQLMGTGELFPDDLVIGIVKETFEGELCQNGFILDGFPRTVPQAKALHTLFQQLSYRDVIIISLDAHDDEIIQRLTNRRSCKECENIFNLLLNPELETCPVCGSVGSIYQREDDLEDVIRKRLEVFIDETKPVLEHFGEDTTIIHINAYQSIDSVTTDIVESLSRLIEIPA
ncbi:MAG: adenylate kinase [Ignavibacteria bacterium]|nr:adenylate kinase [Ignavibacteria bacterium]